LPADADVRPSRARGAATAKRASDDGNGRGARTNDNDGERDEFLHELLQTLEALGRGDFTVRMSTRTTGRSNGQAAQLAKALNRVAELNGRLSKDLGRVGRVVGREGRMTERLALEGAGGSWEHSVDSVNRLIDDLVRPTNEVARVLQAVARGDLTQKMSRTIEGQPVKGEFARIGTVVNGMVDQLGSFTDEVTRVAREVGTEGKLGGQAKVKGVSGTWKALTDSVNELASNLTSQVRNIAQVTTAVAKGDLSQKITVDARGEILALKNTINTMVDQLGSFADEVTRVAREVGTEGKLGGQAQVKGVSGTWKDLTDSVNFMAGNLTTQVRNIAQVSAAVARGDLSQKITVEAKGEVAALAETINSMTDTLRIFAEQVTTVAREVGTEGKLGGQADVPGVSGTWKDLTDSVNFMAGNLTSQVRNITQVTTAVARGDLSQKITVAAKGEVAALAATINSMTDTLRAFADEVTRVAREVGIEGRLGGQAVVPGVAGTWKDLTDNVNQLAGNLTSQVRNIAQVTTAVAGGDLSQKITVDARGEILELKSTINTMVDQLGSFADEVTRVAREVGTEGKLGGQAQVRGVSGTWKDLTDNVNQLAGNLTSQVRNIAQVTTAVARGDLSQKITVDARGEILELKSTINTMVDQLSAFADEVTRVAREVGTEGKLGGQAQVKGVSGTWRDLTESVNFMASNLTDQVRDIAQVTTAVARGDLSQKITVDVRGELAELKRTINTMVDQLSAFADEVTRVAREVGTEGRLGGQADVPGVSGTWKGLTDNVNQLAGNLTTQVRNIAQVTTAVAKGDLSQKITVGASGEVAELKDTINTMVDQLSAFADEVTRVAREVGTEGRLGGQADVPGVSGTWKGLTDNVNQLAGNLTSQVRNIAQVTTAVAKGDLSQKITVDARGEILELKSTINTMVDQLGSFADEVTRVAREVGTLGKLGGQADVRGVSGTWKALTENVNELAGNLTGQVRNIAQVTTAVAKGDLSQKITVDARGEILELKSTINTMVDQLGSFADEVTRVAREVGTEGKLGGQAQVRGVSGTWKDLTDNVNQLAGNLTGQVRNIAQVTTAVAKGDLSQKITVDVRGELLELKNTINTMVDQLGSFADEVTRVAREVGTEGKLGGQAEVRGVAGTWKDLTDSVNSMADNLTDQVRNIAQVTTAVAKGDLSQKITVDARGEILELKNTINTMVDQLGSFATEVTRVAREVGTEGRLGGQAEVEDVSGTWRRLTESVNQLAGNLTTQVRAIAEVSTAVTQGDLTRSITVDATGEVGDLKDTINQMIGNLKETTQRNEEQDWLKSNLARISAMLQGQRDLEAVSGLIMSELTPLVSAQHGAFFFAADDKGEVDLRLIASYGFTARKGVKNHFKLGEGLVGQAALEKRVILVTDAPPDYIRISSGLGETPPVNVVVLPVVFEEQVLGVIELATVRTFTSINQAFLEQIVETVGVVVATIIANTRTEELLKESQRLTQELQSQSEELQSQQDELKRSNLELEDQAQSLKASEELLQVQQQELQHTNAELEEKAAQLAEQNRAIEVKNSEIELARGALEERAEQLAISSRYKSEFLANMSHELRTPLNSLLILAKLLSDNPGGNLTDKQVEFSRSIHGAGADLLALISDILDLTKVEAGKMELAPSPFALADLAADLEATFRPLADQKGLTLTVNVDPGAPVHLDTDGQRLEQVLNNLLSNAVKFTDSGSVTLDIRPAPPRAVFHDPRLRAAAADAANGVPNGVVAFRVTDTGLGIPADKHMMIFEAFQQADGTTSRKYGGTGLGLSIAREIARLLGGEIHVESAPGAGSTFTFYVPATLPPVEPHLAPSPTDITSALALATAPAGGADDEPAPQAVTVATADADDAADDRRTLQPGDRVLLVVGADTELVDTSAELGRARGFKVLVARRGDAALDLVRDHHPDAILLDTALPGIDGLALLEELKRLSPTRHIPVHIISGSDQRHSALAAGALAYFQKPVSPDDLNQAVGELMRFIETAVRRVLVVEDDERERASIMELVGGDDQGVEVVGVGSGEEALAALEEKHFDCMVLDLKLPRTSGFGLLENLKSDPRFSQLPVIVYTGKELTRREETRLKKYAETIIVKDVRSPERLLDETALFLHRVEAKLPAEKRRMIEQLHSADAVFRGKRVLIVDDDVRNVFALTSALEGLGMDVLFAENGRDALEVLESDAGFDLVLMDMMMPEMDGYETMRQIRAPLHGDERFARLPVIALTAKAMKGDREQSIAAGASDYITKPVDVEQLLSLMRVWLY
jgi:HAMP domain-containing protein/CheY-like chemotaxis protein/putative methionine-R-sulfoxide reductase with GAF domain